SISSGASASECAAAWFKALSGARVGKAEPSPMKVKSISVMRVRGSVSLPASSSVGKARVLDGKAVVGGDKRSESGEALPAEAGMPVPGGDGGRTAAALSGDGGGEGGVALGAGGGT